MEPAGIVVVVVGGAVVVVVVGAVVVVVVVEVVEVVVVVRGAGRFAQAGDTKSVTSTHDDRTPSLTTFRRIGAFHHTESRLQGADDAVWTGHSAHRSTIFQKLEPILGEEEAEALLSQFPARDLDEPVTREFVRAELAEFRGEVRVELAELRAELAELRVEMHRLANRMLVSMSAVTIAAMSIAVTLARLS